jgi:glutathione-regulated potassium-efflux system ancillary protein KefC
MIARRDEVRVTEIWSQAALWLGLGLGLGLALVATLASIWLRIATARSEIVDHRCLQ